jgi:hypothetical protein
LEAKVDIDMEWKYVDKETMEKFENMRILGFWKIVPPAKIRNHEVEKKFTRFVKRRIHTPHKQTK